MPRSNPRRITRKKLLRYTGQQADCKQIQSALDNHDRAVAALKKQGLDWNPDIGRLSVIPDSKTINPEDLKDE